MKVYSVKYYKNRILIYCMCGTIIKIKHHLGCYEFKFHFDDPKSKEYLTCYCGHIGYNLSENGRSLRIGLFDKLYDRPSGSHLTLKSFQGYVDLNKLIHKILALNTFKKWDKAIDPRHKDILDQVIQDNHKKLIKCIKDNK